STIPRLPLSTLFPYTTLFRSPHALGLAIPLVISRSTSLGSVKGLLVKNREAYNLTTKANIMILDKTGTLATGEFKVQEIDILDEIGRASCRKRVKRLKVTNV